MVLSTSIHFTTTVVTPINSNLASLTISTSHSSIRASSSSHMSYKTSISIYNTTLIPVPTSQLTTNNMSTTLAAVISTVFILLVVTILVILLVSVLVYRRRLKNGISTSTASYLVTDAERASAIQTTIPQQPQGTILSIGRLLKYYYYYIIIIIIIIIVIVRNIRL